MSTILDEMTREERLRAAYHMKVEDFANETRKVGKLVDGMRRVVDLHKWTVDHQVEVFGDLALGPTIEDVEFCEGCGSLEYPCTTVAILEEVAAEIGVTL